MPCEEFLVARAVGISAQHLGVAFTRHRVDAGTEPSSAFGSPNSVLPLLVRFSAGRVSPSGPGVCRSQPARTEEEKRKRKGRIIFPQRRFDRPSPAFSPA